jgi:hypothetical protein
METSFNQGVLCFNSGDNWSHKFISRPKSPALMAAASIPAVNCSESDTGWFAELIQMARHCDTANRISAKPESTRMHSETISLFSNSSILQFSNVLANGPRVLLNRDFRAVAEFVKC